MTGIILNINRLHSLNTCIKIERNGYNVHLTLCSLGKEPPVVKAPDFDSITPVVPGSIGGLPRASISESEQDEDMQDMQNFGE